MLAETQRKRNPYVDLSQKFQSPCGDYVGGNPGMPHYRREPYCLLRFSPLAGIMLAETEVLARAIKREFAKFQSPCGDYVGGNSHLVVCQFGILKFQSPCGDYVGGNFLPYVLVVYTMA